ncbi:hypothetical protein CSB45_01470 [candidate division KSB3 bacterium]|uniref:Uncharacterized protein n=1 Tax=candidate division KSB3 bacterium TaxID=2044937 RepID=A0A2G6EAI3_9BACT|nr:MAG: hypothetical protein CSB45_01470 [candidate division KSB3 bacterium]PIE30735.1 MAG: hypothetical protein CSA57_01880 [candidate division KSB3 bacterium]
MKRYVMIALAGVCVFGFFGLSEAALDWQIRWNDTESPQVAKVYIFNPESTDQSFSLEIGDVAKTSNTGPYAPYLIIGQDVSLRLEPGERKIFDIIVYQDIDPDGIYAVRDAVPHSLSPQAYQILLSGRPASDNSRQSQYPIDSRGISPVPRYGQEESEYNYRHERGYWKLILVDHDHVAEQLIRTGNRTGGGHRSIQQAILFYTQGSVALSQEAEEVFYTAFPEIDRSVPQPQFASCTCYVTLSLPAAASVPSVMTGAVLGPRDQGLTTVVAADDIAYNAPGSTKKKLLHVFLMKKMGVPYESSEYVRFIRQDSQIERMIRIGKAESYSNCAIQDVIWYMNKEVTALTEGQLLWKRVGKTDSKQRTGHACFGAQTAKFAELGAKPQNWKNVALLLGMVVPFGLIFQRKGRK